MSLSDSHQNFEKLLEESLQSQTFFNKGEKATLLVVGITTDAVFVDIGGKREAFLNKSEFLDEDNLLTVNIGDKIDGFFEGVVDGMMKFTTLINGYPLKVINYIEESFADKREVRGVVIGEIKGGYEVRVKGIRCFCPHSHIGFKNDSEDHVGKEYDFIIIDYKKEPLSVVLSRRVLLEELKRQRILDLRQKINIGDEIKAQITSIRNFGLFVDIGGLEGFIPISELSWGRTDKIEGLFKEGQMIDAKVMTADFDNEKITLSCKAMQADPWIDLDQRYPIGSRVTVKVTRIMPYGVFANIEDGVEGLIHISNLATGRRIKHPSEVVREGDILDAYVLSVDMSNRKMSLTLRSMEKKEIIFPNEGDIIDVTVSKLMPFGILARISDDITGMIPMGESGLSKGEDIKSVFPEGANVKVVVQEVDKERTRVSLSRKAYLEIKGREEYSQYLQQQKQSDKGGMGILGDLIEATIKAQKG
ncbi:MAG: S1 RNA-binding domain-containing protein [Thermodesulfovibrionales bacterium]